MGTKNKPLISADEDDILKCAEKIKQNRNENEKFSKSFNEFLNGNIGTDGTLFIETTPFALQIAGAKPLPITVATSTLVNTMNPEDVKMKHHTSGHDIAPSIIIKLPQMLREPIMVIKDKNSDNLTAILDEKDKQGRNIICRIALDQKEKQHIVNRLSSMYGKRELAAYIDRAFKENRVMAIHKEKAESLLQSIGCQSPKEETAIGFDDSIAYSKQNVKYPSEKILLKSSQDRLTFAEHIEQAKEMQKQNSSEKSAEHKKPYNRER